jgi:hypothetical protein
MDAALPREQVLIRLSIDLPSDLAAEYESQARTRGITLEQLLSERLSRCVSHAAASGLYFSDSERNELERLLGRQVKTAADAIRHVAKLVTISVEGIKVGLTPRLITRIKSRTFRQPLAEVVKREVRAGLELFCGMR